MAKVKEFLDRQDIPDAAKRKISHDNPNKRIKLLQTSGLPK
jgi:hypothetical protein